MPQLILVVDDDVDYLAQIRVQLESVGYEVETVETSAAAREFIGRRRPDLVLADLMMEEPDAGFSLCYHIKKQDATIPVVIITSVTSTTGLSFDAETPEERAWIKADALLAKPVRFEQLDREMQRLMKITC